MTNSQNDSGSETEISEQFELPQKKFYRQRAHSNPLNDHSFDYPTCPEDMDWSLYYNFDILNETSAKEIQFADIGCGYGGLLLELSSIYPNKLSLGMEIRVKVSDYVQDRIKALRAKNPEKFQNIACIRSNAMKYLPNFFKKGQLEKIFFLYPDPHFKKSKYKWRIVNYQLLAEYAYVLKEGGIVYTVTDVEDLHNWFVKHFEEFPLFERMQESEYANDPIVPKLFDSSEEGKKVILLIYLVQMPELKAKNEKALYKYTQLMKNIINIQERKGKIENEGKKPVPKASIKSVKDGKKSVVASLKTNCSNRSKKPPITRKPSSVSNLNPLRTILKNSQSNENLKRVGREPTKTRLINHVDNFRSRSADFSSFQKCSVQKSIDWNNLKDLIDLHLSEFSSKDKTIKPCIQTELEVKLNEMKQEIDDLKQTIRNQEFKPHKKPETQTIDSELSHGLNCIISNYSEKLAYINQQIVNMKNKKGSENVPQQAPYYKNIKFSHDYLDQVESELKEYKVKCSQLELELDSKNKQIEEYSALFKEISENVSGLIMEMENKGKETTSESMSVNVTESKSINNLLMNLAKFEKAIKPENGLDRAKKKSKDLSTTDTLIDADSSFADFAESLKRANFNSRGFNHQLNLINNLSENQVLKPFTENDLLKKQKKNFFCTRSVVTNLKNQFNDLYVDEDDEEKIVFNMEDLSITTIQTSGNTTETVESMPPLKNDQDDEFQKDLDILDQKILKVKKMIDSMKNT